MYRVVSCFVSPREVSFHIVLYLAIPCRAVPYRTARYYDFAGAALWREGAETKAAVGAQCKQRSVGHHRLLLLLLKVAVEASRPARQNKGSVRRHRKSHFVTERPRRHNALSIKRDKRRTKKILDEGGLRSFTSPVLSFGLESPKTRQRSALGTTMRIRAHPRLTTRKSVCQPIV